ncbi:MAG: HIT family protein [Pseudomonadota bacterium]
MTLHDDYDPDNIFAKILNGDMPCVKVFEDEVALAFMDIFPQSKGHTLVIPKDVAARNLLDMPADRLGPYMARVQTLARAVEQALSPDGIVVTQFNGAAAGQTVFHLHFHIIPRWDGTPLGRHGAGGPADTADLEPLAASIRAALT